MAVSAVARECIWSSERPGHAFRSGGAPIIRRARQARRDPGTVSDKNTAAHAFAAAVALRIETPWFSRRWKPLAGVVTRHGASVCGRQRRRMASVLDHSPHNSPHHPADSLRRPPRPLRRATTMRRAASERLFNGQQNAHRRHPYRRDAGGGRSRKSRRGIRLRKRQSQATARQYLSSQGHAGRAVVAGGVHRLRRKPSRLPRLLGNPSRLLPDPGRRSAGAARGRGARAERG